MEGAQDYGVLHFTGLNPERAYRFHSFGSRTSDDARAAWFTFSGENVWTGEMQMGGSKIGNGGYNGNAENPFSNNIPGFKHYILLNLAIGANGGEPDISQFPLRYYIDYVRVYE